MNLPKVCVCVRVCVCVLVRLNGKALVPMRFGVDLSSELQEVTAQRVNFPTSASAVAAPRQDDLSF